MSTENKEAPPPPPPPPEEEKKASEKKDEVAPPAPTAENEPPSVEAASEKATSSENAEELKLGSAAPVKAGSEKKEEAAAEKASSETKEADGEKKEAEGEKKEAEGEKKEAENKKKEAEGEKKEADAEKIGSDKKDIAPVQVASKKVEDAVAAIAGGEEDAASATDTESESIATTDTEDEVAAAAAEAPAPKAETPAETTALCIDFNQNYNALRVDCLTRNALFEDPLFPASISLLHHKNEKPLKELELHKWKRPRELSLNPKFVGPGFLAIDQNRRKYESRWLLIAVACFTHYPDLFRVVVPRGQSFTEGYAGIFHFKFWREQGGFCEIVIDDILPSFHDYMAFTRSEDMDDFFVALLEKAYAKFLGLYPDVFSRPLVKVLEDFSGGSCREILIKKKPPVDFFQTLSEGVEKHWLQICVANKKAKGNLARFHPYHITNVVSVKMKKKEIQLIRLFNYWGDHHKWMGPWRDDSKNWKKISEDEKKRIGYKSGYKKGEFWMAFLQFQKIFNEILICQITR